MKIERFDLERWMTTWELDVDFDIAESGILPLSIDEICSLIGETEAAELERRIRETLLGYSEARGTLELRSIIADTYERATPDDILVTTGAIEANFLLFNTLLEAGDHVVAVSPAYQQLHSVPRAIGCELDLWSVETEHGFAYDLDRLEALIRNNTKLIVINTPHNPTGAMLDESQLRDVVAIADRVGAWILSDEAYRWLEHPGGEKLPPPLHDLTDRAVSVGTMSKPFGLPGLRIGWFAANADIAQRAWGLRDYTSLSPAKLSDIITQTVISQRDRILPRNGAIIAENMTTARAWFAGNADLASWTEPRAGLLAMMKYNLPIDSTTLADGLARDVRVMLAPGASFGLEGHLRIGVGPRPDLFAEGLRRTAAYFAAIREKSAAAV
ncbi:MAG TPA: aminotransferase class I/II-fold pyridoxal phosphate-dependent enzyme [Thermomicrobiales bacterium]|nr:aminotransferase class I/II-fold pyridoxal phosphate-dependent enzyme [Thermomicrobiales bacterium]